LSLEDLGDWEKRIAEHPEEDPETFMRKQRQSINDCQGQSIANVVEAIYQWKTKQLVQISDMAAYQLSEIRGGSFGTNSGSSIHAGIRQALDGIPDEQTWPYKINGRINYLTDRREFERRWSAAKSNAAQYTIGSYEPMPTREKMLACVACRGCGHWGTRWPLRWNTERIVTSYRGSGNAAHATTPMYPVRKYGRWMLKVLNSHGDGFYYVEQAAYEEIISNNPWGCFVALPPEPLQRYYTGQFNVMG